MSHPWLGAATSQPLSLVPPEAPAPRWHPRAPSRPHKVDGGSGVGTFATPHPVFGGHVGLLQSMFGAVAWPGFGAERKGVADALRQSFGEDSCFFNIFNPFGAAQHRSSAPRHGDLHPHGGHLLPKTPKAVGTRRRRTPHPKKKTTPVTFHITRLPAQKSKKGRGSCKAIVSDRSK